MSFIVSNYGWCCCGGGSGSTTPTPVDVCEVYDQWPEKAIKEDIVIVTDNIFPPLAQVPIDGSLVVVVNGYSLSPFVDYTVAGNQITYDINGPHNQNLFYGIQSGANVWVTYRYKDLTICP